MKKTIVVSFHTEHRYEIEDEDPAFLEVGREEIMRLAKMMLYIDVFQSMEEQEILDHIEVDLTD